MDGQHRDTSISHPVAHRSAEPTSARAPSQIRFDQHVRLFDYWNAKRRLRPMPARADIDAAQLGTLLPYLTLLDRTAGGFRYRIMGHHAVSDLGHDYAGTLVGAHSEPAYAASLRNVLARVADERLPLFVEGVYMPITKSARLVARLFLPLGAEDGFTDMILVSRVARRSGSLLPTTWDVMVSARLQRIEPVADRAALTELCAEWESGLLPVP